MKIKMNTINIKEQSGVSLIEAVVSLFIFSIGALGLAALQLTSLSASGDSQQRSIAIWKAQEFVDRVRANGTILDSYITAVNNSSLATIGVDSAANVVSCGSGAYQEPTTMCAANSSGAGSTCTDDADKVAYDLWEVFCHPSTGLAISGSDANQGSAGVTNLEVVLRQNDVATDGDSDVLLVMEWLSRETDANSEIAANENLQMDVCGSGARNIASSLDVYCVRFRP